MEYVGFKIIDPSVAVGIDIAAEYEEEKRCGSGIASIFSIHPPFIRHSSSTA